MESIFVVGEVTPFTILSEIALTNPTAALLELDASIQSIGEGNIICCQHNMLATYARIIVLETTRQGQIWSEWYTGCWQPPSYLSGMQPRTSLYLHLEQVNTDPEQFYAMTCKHLSSHRKLWSHPTPDGVPSWFSSAPNTPDTPDVPEIAASLTRCGEVPTRGGSGHLSKNSFSIIFSQRQRILIVCCAVISEVHVILVLDILTGTKSRSSWWPWLTSDCEWSCRRP